MNHYQIQLIDDPQWVSYCVENGCCFTDDVHGYVCLAHSTRHVCSGSSCTIVKHMVQWTRCDIVTPVSQCPVAALLVFRPPEVEFRSGHSMSHTGDHVEAGYGGLECSFIKKPYSSEVDVKQLILKAGLSVMTALFSTTLTDDFNKEYKLVHTDHRGTSSNVSSAAACSPWMSKIFKLAKEIESKPRAELRCPREMISIVRDAVLKSTMAVATMFNSQNERITRFMRKLASKYNDKHATRTDFRVMVVMVTLCLFPYLQHRVLGDMFDSRTLVFMCFDKTITKHSQWSTLSTYVHLHAKRPAFAKRVLSNRDHLKCSLPAVITATLDKYISDAIDCTFNRVMDQDQIASSNQARISGIVRSKWPLRQTGGHGDQCPVVCGRKRKTPCSSGFYEEHQVHHGQKVVCVHKDLHQEQSGDLSEL